MFGTVLEGNSFKYPFTSSILPKYLLSNSVEINLVKFTE